MRNVLALGTRTVSWSIEHERARGRWLESGDVGAVGRVEYVSVCSTRWDLEKVLASSCSDYDSGSGSGPDSGRVKWTSRKKHAGTDAAARATAPEPVLEALTDDANAAAAVADDAEDSTAPVIDRNNCNIRHHFHMDERSGADSSSAGGC